MCADYRHVTHVFYDARMPATCTCSALQCNANVSCRPCDIAFRVAMIRFSIGDVTEDRPALHVRSLGLHIFSHRTRRTGHPSPSPSSWQVSRRPRRLVVFHVAGCREGSCILVQLQAEWANDSGELRWARGKGWRILCKEGGRAVRLGIHFFLTISPAGGCLFRHPDKGAAKPPKEGHPLGVSYIYRCMTEFVPKSRLGSPGLRQQVGGQHPSPRGHLFKHQAIRLVPSMHACCQDDFELEAEAPIPSLNEVLNSALHAGTAEGRFGAERGQGTKTAKCRALSLHARWQADDGEEHEACIYSL